MGSEMCIRDRNNLVKFQFYLSPAEIKSFQKVHSKASVAAEFENVHSLLVVHNNPNGKGKAEMKYELVIDANR